MSCLFIYEGRSRRPNTMNNALRLCLWEVLVDYRVFFFKRLADIIYVPGPRQICGAVWLCLWGHCWDRRGCCVVVSKKHEEKWMPSLLLKFTYKDTLSTENVWMLLVLQSALEMTPHSSNKSWVGKKYHPREERLIISSDSGLGRSCMLI